VIEVNCFKSKGAPFKDFRVNKLLAAGNIQIIYSVIDEVSQAEVADCEFRGGWLYVRGKVQEIAERVRGMNVAVLAEPEAGFLDPAKPGDVNIIRAIFYRALARHAHSRGFVTYRRVKGGRKRLLPRLEALEELVDKDLAYKISDKMAVVRGLYVLLDVYGSGEALLWVDVYSPIVNLEKGVPLSPREAKRLGLEEKYTQFIPQPHERHDLQQKLLKMLFGEGVGVTLADGFRIEFESNALTLKGVLRYGGVF